MKVLIYPKVIILTKKYKSTIHAICNTLYMLKLRMYCTKDSLKVMELPSAGGVLEVHGTYYKVKCPFLHYCDICYPF